MKKEDIIKNHRVVPILLEKFIVLYLIITNILKCFIKAKNRLIAKTVFSIILSYVFWIFLRSCKKLQSSKYVQNRRKLGYVCPHHHTHLCFGNLYKKSIFLLELVTQQNIIPLHLLYYL